jgi:hypothetical protein
LPSSRGVLEAPIYRVSPFMGANLIIVVFAVVVIGSMGSIQGCPAAAGSSRPRAPGQGDEPGSLIPPSTDRRLGASRPVLGLSASVPGRLVGLGQSKLAAMLDQPAGDGEAQEGPEDIVLAVLRRQGGEDGSPAARDTVAEQIEDRRRRAGNAGMDLVAAARAAGGVHSVGDDEPPGSESRPWRRRAKLS